MAEALADPQFPPLLTGHPVAPDRSPFDVAVYAAQQGSAGAGDLYWSRAENVAAFAVVLEPDRSRAEALKAHYALMVAFGDALGAIGPPEVAVHYRWPNRLLVNGGEAGRCRMALPAGDDPVPAWLVLGLDVALLPAVFDGEPGEQPGRTFLWQEGCGEVTRTALIESIARHFLAWIDTLISEGFRQVHDNWTGRRETGGRVRILDRGRAIEGAFETINAAGDLVFRPAGSDRATTVRLADQAIRPGG